MRSLNSSPEGDGGGNSDHQRTDWVARKIPEEESREH